MRNPRRNAYMSQVYQDMLDDLQYPVAKDGSVMDASAIKAWVAWHLVRCGWRKPNDGELIDNYDAPVIKKRRVYGTGVMEDAVNWVGVDEPDDPLSDLPNMTMAEIEGLPEDLRAEARRRLGLAAPQPDSDPQPAWSVKPFITIADEPDVDDGTEWTPERTS